MPIYNVADYIERAIDSFDKQTNSNFEVLMVNDGSTDESQTVCEKIVSSHENYRLINHEKNRGISAARNTGIENAEGDLITFADADDWVEPQYVDFFITSYVSNPGLDLACCGFYIEDEKGSNMKEKIIEQGLVDRNDIVRKITAMNTTVMGYAWNKAYRVDVIKENNLTFDTDINLMEDQIFNVAYATKTSSFFYDSTPLYHYVQRKKSLSHKYGIDNVRNVGVANYRINKMIIQNRIKVKKDI